MYQVKDALKSISAYPIPDNAVMGAAIAAGIDVEDEVTTELQSSASFKKAKAGIYEFLADAPNISQGGVSYSFTATEKANFRKKASDLLNEASEAESGESVGVGYGWQGEDL